MKDRFCPSCGRQPAEDLCCWSIRVDRPQPCPLVSPPPWEQWDDDAQFLIRLLMEEFGGAAEEWELLRRLPWPRYRLDQQVIDFDERLDDTALAFPCLRETDDRDRGRRYFLTDLARASFAQRPRGDAEQVELPRIALLDCRSGSPPEMVLLPGHGP